MRLPMAYRAALFATLLVTTACAAGDPSATGPLAQVDETSTTLDEPGRSLVEADDGEADGPTTTEPAAVTTTTEAPDNSITSSSTTSSSTAEETTTTTIAPSDLDRALEELIPFVERERGHEFLTAPVVTQLEGQAFVDAFAAVVERSADRYAQDYTNFTEIYHAMGIIGPDENLEDIWSSFGDAGILGFYDREEEKVFLRGSAVDEFTKIVLVHELVHALDDQIFGIERPEYDDRDDEVAWAFSAVLEGNARVIENRYRDTLSASERAAAVEQQRNLPRGTSLRLFTESFLELQSAKYVYGERLMTELWSDGVDAVDAAMVSPPAASEQVLNPEMVVRGDAADGPIPAPPADGRVFEQGVWGQIALESILRDELDADRARAAADGWGGDWYVAWSSGSQTCVRLDVQTDSADDLDELADALEAWAVRGDREVYYPTADLVRVTACG